MQIPITSISSRLAIKNIQISVHYSITGELIAFPIKILHIRNGITYAITNLSPMSSTLKDFLSNSHRLITLRIIKIILLLVSHFTTNGIINKLLHFCLCCLLGRANQSFYCE